MNEERFLKGFAGAVPMTETDDGIELAVPSKRVARLVQLGLHAERSAKARRDRRRAQRASRRRNRPNR